MNIERKIPQQSYEYLAERILMRTWEDIPVDKQEECDIFYPLLQQVFWDICKDKTRLEFIVKEIENYFAQSEEKNE